MQARIGSRRALLTVCLAILIGLLASGQAEAGKVRGTVVDRHGNPAAGAKVWIAKLGSREQPETHAATADGSGAFSIEAGPASWAAFALRGNEGGRVGWTSFPRVEDGKDPAPVTVRLAAPSTLMGRLIDAVTGKPVTKGRVALDDARVLDVDSDGRFEAPGLSLANHELCPLCPGYDRKGVLFDTTGRPDAELELKLQRAGKVVGRVVDENTKPIPGATVGLGRSFSSSLLISAQRENCSEDGRFSCDGSPLGRTGRLLARAPGFQDQVGEVVLDEASNAAAVDFTLRPDPTAGSRAKEAARAMKLRTVSGTILGPEGNPVASAVVRWGFVVDSSSRPETKTDARGTFRLEGLPDAADILTVLATGLAPSFPQVDAGGDRRVTVGLTAGATIRGRVVDESGSPIEGAKVTPRADRPQPNRRGVVRLHELQVKTDRNGRFTLAAMPEGVTCDVLDDVWGAGGSGLLSPSDESENVVTMHGDGAIRGRVVDPTGRPVRNFRIQVGIPKGFQRGNGSLVGGYYAGYEDKGVAFTRDDGEFVISRLTPRHLHLLTAIADGIGLGEVDRVEARSVHHLNPADAVTIELNLPRHALRVRVFREDGKLFEGARVMLFQNGRKGGFQWGESDTSWDDGVNARVDSTGWAEFPALAFRTGTVAVRVNGYTRRKLDWVKDEEELFVNLEPESRLTGTVLDEGGKPLARAHVLLSWGDGSMNVPIDETDGRFLADGLNSGPCVLNVITDANAKLLTDSIELELGKTHTRNLRVTRPKPGARAGR